jgi:hypothetical protein
VLLPAHRIGFGEPRFDHVVDVGRLMEAEDMLLFRAEKKSIRRKRGLSRCRARRTWLAEMRLEAIRELRPQPGHVHIARICAQLTILG